jgi:outer membrane protein assembly factor BamE (lipoprotein component of BamABCDE complex)
MKPEKWLLAASLAMLFAGSVFANGRIESVALLDKIQPGVTTAQQVRELLGPPANTMHFPARGLDSLEYEARDYSDRLVISISIGSNGIVREVMRLRQSGSGAGM